jgi:pyruvate dehydrogenase E2 component (dihydrolipoamide acetyltransferase)
MELESEKAVMDLPCPHGGRIVGIHVSEGDRVEVGQKLLTIESDDARDDAEPEGDEEAAESQADEEAAEPDRDDDEGGKSGAEAGIVAANNAEHRDRGEATSDAEEETGEAATERGAAAPAGPATRRLARELGVELKALTADDGETILQEDVVRAYLERQRSEMVGDPGELPDFTAFGPVEREKLGEVARTASERLAANWRAIPHVTQHGAADITEIEEERRRYMDADEERPAKVTLTAIAVSAVCGVLKELPRFNASLDRDAGEIVLKRYYNIGVAVDTDRGLLVPVVRDADRKSVQEIAGEIADLAERARQRRLGREQLEGATFSISNQGGIGGAQFTPIIDWPQAAILGIGRAVQVAKVIDGEVSGRLELPLSLSYDHRIVNGADAARFIERLAAILSAPSKLMIEA